MGHLEIRSKNVIYILETLFDIFSGLAIGYAHRSRVWVIGCLEALVCLEEKARRSKGFWSCYVMFHRELMLEYVGSWEKSGEFGLETGKLQHHMSHLLRNLRIQSDHYLANFLLITSGPDGVKCNGSTAVVDPMSLRASLIDLLIWYVFSFKWLIWLYNDWTGLNYIVRLGLGVWWVPLSHTTSLCPKMKHTHTPISTSQSSHYLPQEQSGLVWSMCQF